MSGHSHWATIKHKKGAADAKRSKVFSKITRQISIAAREKGGDPESNPALRIAVEQARAANMPAENIERAIKKGTGELEGEKLEAVTFEAYGPGGIALIVEGITDNKNRTLGEIKQIFNLHNGKLAGEGSVKWMFERKGCLTVLPEEQTAENQGKETLELKAIEAGADDIRWQEYSLDVYTKPEELDKTREALEGKGVKVNSSSLDWVAKEEISPSGQDQITCQKLFEALDDNDSVQEIYSNTKH